jgi:hypothetical protein
VRAVPGVVAVVLVPTLCVRKKEDCVFLRRKVDFLVSYSR